MVRHRITRCAVHVGQRPCALSVIARWNGKDGPQARPDFIKHFNLLQKENGRTLKLTAG